MCRSTLFLVCTVAVLPLVPAADPPPIDQPANTWVKRSPLAGGPVSPGMGYEASLGYDPVNRRVIRWGGHNQGGGGEQNAETWVYDPATAKWELKEPNKSPPGVCCAQQNVFDVAGGRFLRFQAFSGSHGWQWFREIYLNNSAVWGYDLGTNTWRDARPLPAPRLAPLRCAAWDADAEVAVVFGGEGSNEGTLVYDPYVNTWTRMNPKPQPASRSGGNMAYDAARKLHILFGSQFDADPHTWAYDLRRNEWRDLKPAVQPPTTRNDAVLAYDAAGRVVVAVVRAADAQDKNDVVRGHLETWAFDAGANTWTRMNPAREPDSWGNRRRIAVAVPDLNLILMEAFVNPSERVPGVEREQQVWTYRYAERKPDAAPQPPASLAVTITADSATLRWPASPSPGVAGYAVYRGEGAQQWSVAWKRVAQVAADRGEFRDPGLTGGTVYHYAVRAVAAEGRESADSPKGRAQPRVIEDVVASVIGPREVRLTWAAPTAGDVVGYHVERAVVEVFTEDQILRLKKDTPSLAEPSVGALQTVGPFERITKTPRSDRALTDTDVDLTRPAAVTGEPVYRHRFRPDQLDPAGKAYRYAVYAYRVRAINALVVESGPSAYALTIPSAPQWLFAKEDGARCHLKWAANPERGLTGYRVYRMESPRINGPGQPVTRLTSDPQSGTRFTDERAGTATRRFWVVAVDALGQEGFPSAPAWYMREYRRFYGPFVGEWHQ